MPESEPQPSRTARAIAVGATVVGMGAILVAVGEGIDVTVAGVELGYDLPKPVTIALMIGGLSSFLGGQHANHRDMRRGYRSDDQ